MKRAIIALLFTQAYEMESNGDLRIEYPGEFHLALNQFINT